MDERGIWTSAAYSACILCSYTALVHCACKNTALVHCGCILRLYTVLVHCASTLRSESVIVTLSKLDKHTESGQAQWASAVFWQARFLSERSKLASILFRAQYTSTVYKSRFRAQLASAVFRARFFDKRGIFPSAAFFFQAQYTSAVFYRALYFGKHS